MESGEETLSPPTFHFDPKSAVTLLVGPEEYNMLVPGNKLAENSEFFAAALKKEWTEGQTRLIKLPEEDPVLVAHYVGFMFGDDLPTSKLSTEAFVPAGGDGYKLLAKLYALGERMLDTKYRNAIVYEIFRLKNIACSGKHAHHYPGPGAVRAIYDGTTASSPARRMVVDFAVRHGDASWLTSGDPHFEYLRDLGYCLRDHGPEWLCEMGYEDHDSCGLIGWEAFAIHDWHSRYNTRRLRGTPRLGRISTIC